MSEQKPTGNHQGNAEMLDDEEILELRREAEQLCRHERPAHDSDFDDDDNAHDIDEGEDAADYDDDNGDDNE